MKMINVYINTYFININKVYANKKKVYAKTFKWQCTHNH